MENNNQEENKFMTSLVQSNIFKIIIKIFCLILLLFVLTISGFVIFIKVSLLSSLKDRTELLSSFNQFPQDTVAFSFSSAKDDNTARQISDYFRLDSLTVQDSVTWERALSIGRFVSTIGHGNPESWPDCVNAIGIWEYVQNVESSINCRLHSILTYELLSAIGITCRYVTCYPASADDTDCHVVNEVWLPELSKWAMIDTDMGGNYVSDKQGIPLSLIEIRKSYENKLPMRFHPNFGKGQHRLNYYVTYLAKNVFWFGCWECLHYCQEDDSFNGKEKCVYLFPEGFTPFNIDDNDILTTDKDRFWASPN